jgi:ferritin
MLRWRTTDLQNIAYDTAKSVAVAVRVEVKMQISKKMQDAINNQINRELYSAYLYLSMSAYCEDQNLPGFAHWMRAQAQEEVFHAMKLFIHVVERGGRAVMGDIEAPPKDWASPEDVFQATYNHEQKVTKLIDNLVKTAREEGDNAAEAMLQWFVNEQVEEESTAQTILRKLQMVGDAKAGLFLIDQELSARPLMCAPPQAGKE